MTTSQLCLRAGGKHNDLENVGYTPRHHTLFEMLGNFSFEAAVSKEEACRLAWRYLTEELQMDEQRLSITYFKDDRESVEIWRRVTGWSEERMQKRVIPMGEEDNFWSAGSTGPCGPCTEIFWDRQDKFDDNEERWLEVWNLVFMEHERLDDGSTIPLPKPCVDTGKPLWVM